MRNKHLKVRIFYILSYKTESLLQRKVSTYLFKNYKVFLLILIMFTKIVLLLLASAYQPVSLTFK